MSGAPVTVGVDAAALAPARFVAPREQRVAAAIVGAMLLAMLVTGAILQPAAAGHGTHTQLGMPPCGWALATGKPCPTCGMTTAVTLAAHGRIFDAFATQPGGALVAIGAAMGVWICLSMAAFGANWGPILSKLLTGKVLWLAAGIFAASWAYTMWTWPKM